MKNKKLIKTLMSSLLVLSMISPMLPVFSAEDMQMKELENLRGLNGNWNFSDTVRCSGSGDMFAISDSHATNFVYEADVEFKKTDGAASLMFFAGDNPSQGSYIANIDLSAGNARIFAFTSGGAVTKGEYRLTNAQKAKSKFHMRVEVSGDSMVFLLDSQPIVTVSDSSLKAGDKLGLLDYNTSLVYSNVRWCELSESSPELSELLGLSSTFYGQNSMKETLPFGTKELTLKARAENGTISARVSNGALAKLEGNLIKLYEISESFDLVITVSKGALARSYTVSFKLEADPAAMYRDDYRPLLHFSPYVNWLNDPNGLVFDPSDNSWHLFFQYNPYGLNIANQVWGHAVSSDLMHWKELDIAIGQDSFGAVFSGSAVVDENNTSGFFSDNTEGQSKLVALYTSDGGDSTHGVEKQCIAYSKDHGVTWIKPDLQYIDKNIVISNKNNVYGRDFRDPKIFRYDNRWFMAVAGGRARLFVSDDLIHWSMACDMGFDSECPDFYPLPLDGDANNIKWVYTASGRWYTVGRLEKISDTKYKFVEEGQRTTYNGGQQIYATQSFYNDSSKAGRRIAISWLQDSSAGSLDGKGWNGAMTLPHEQKLVSVNGKMILTSYPVSELDAMRSGQLAKLENPSNEKVDSVLCENPGRAYDIVTVFKPEKGSLVTFTLRKSGENNVQVIYDMNAKMLKVIRGRASSKSGSIPTETMQMPLYPDKEGNITLRIVMDTTVIEVFGNNGEAACSGMIFPEPEFIGSSFETQGNVSILTFDMWSLSSARHKDETILPKSGLYVDAPSEIPLDAERTLIAYLINDKGEKVQDSVTWDKADSPLVQVISKEGGKLVIKAVKEGTLTLRVSSENESKNVVIRLYKSGFTTNVDGWSSEGDWFESDKGWGLNSSSGDSFSFSDKQHKGKFTYSADIDFGGKDGCLGLVFGASNPGSPKSGVWYGANVDTHSGNAEIKLFENRNGNQTWDEKLVLSGKADTYTLKVSYDGQTLTYTVGDRSVSHKIKNLEGTLGLVSWNGGGSFNNISFDDGSTPIDPDIPEKPDNQGNKDTSEDKGGQNEASDERNKAEKSSALPTFITVGALAAAALVAVCLIAARRRKKK